MAAPAARGRKLSKRMQPLDEWRQFMAASGLSPNTIQIRTATIQALARHAGVRDPLNIQPHHAVSFLARDLKPWTRLTYWNSIHAWSCFLTEFGHPGASALTKGIVRPRTPAGVPRPIDDSTICRLLALKLSSRARAYVTLALFASLRVHEIAKIRGEDFADGWLIVTGKGGYTAPIPVHPEVARLAETMPEFGFWFPSPSSPFECVSPIAVSKTITAALRMVGSTATAHQLRDTSATKMQRQVKDIRVTQTMLRHQSIKSTAKYVGVADDAMRQAVLSLSWTAA